MKKFGLLTLAAIALAGCGGKTVVGEWTADNAQMGSGVTGSISQNFKADNTFTSVINVNGMGANLKISLAGTYKVEGEKMTTTATSVGVEGLPPQFKGMENQIKQGIGKTETYTMKWLESGNLQLTPTTGGNALELSRKK